MKTEAIEKIITAAFDEGRTKLFEHEVYGILSLLGIPVPKHTVIRESADITQELLAGYGSSRLVLKVISPEIAHKKKAGGIKIVYKDQDFIKYTFEKLAGSFTERGLPLAGVLLTEYIEYSKDLGNEILLGFRESGSFGPVLSFSKGGTDAEHFARNFSSPNLVLPPITKEWSSALLMSTKIHEKYLDEGKGHYLQKIVEVQERLSELCVWFSNFFPGPAGFAIKEFEINPFIFDFDDNFIALDGYAAFERKDEIPVDISVRPKESLRGFFEPDGICVVGISRSDNSKVGNIIAENLLDLGREDVYCLNPKGGEVVIDDRKIPLYRDFDEIQQSIDLAIVTVPAEATLPVVKSCSDAGIPAVLLIPGGFSETEKNQEVEEQILTIAAESGMRIMGPNCLGVIYAGDKNRKGMNTFFIPEDKFKVSFEKEQNVALITQSGGMGLMEIDNLKNAISPKVIVSYGNQLDIDASDLVQYFEDDPSIDVLGLYIEGFKKGGGRKFFDVSKTCVKPVIVYKAGRPEAGQRATQAHTASISGEYATAKASMKQAGLIVAETVMDHADFVKTFALLHDFNVRGNRVAVVANAGYEKTYAADNLLDMKLAQLDEKTAKELRRFLPSFVNVDSLLDLTPMVTDEDYGKSIDSVLSSPEVDAVCVSIVPHASLIHTTDREIEEYEGNIASRLVKTVAKHKKPVVASISVISSSDAVYNRLGQILEAGGVPTFISAGRAMFCLNEFLKYHLVKKGQNLSEWLKS